MKRYAIIAVCLFLLLAIVGCKSDNSSSLTLTSGNYYIIGDYEKYLTPYLWLDTEDKTFQLGAGSVVSYMEYGTFEIEGGKLIATSQITTYVFEIKDGKTLVLADNGGNAYLKLPINSEFVYSEELR